jgi:hypothetical protein
MNGSGLLMAGAEINWEAMWSPYDNLTYKSVLDQIDQDDIVLDIGAGDLRLACRMAGKCRKVYAIEIQTEIINSFLKKDNLALPKNLLTIPADARLTSFPGDITTGVLLMRHCTHFQLYAEKLKAIGAKRLITNARWRLGIEIVPLQTKRIDYQQLSIGWYACWCGGAGFKTGPVELITPELDSTTAEVSNCPACVTSGKSLEI